MEREHRFVGNLVFLSYFQLSLSCSVVEPRSHITISLYVEMTMRKDILVGRQEIACEPQHGSSFKNSYPCVWLSILQIEIDIVFGGDDGHSTEATTLFLTITELANRNSSLNAAANTPGPTTADVDTPPPLRWTGDLPSESDTPPVQPLVGSQPETSRTALRRAEEAINNVNTIKTWKSAVTNIKWVMDTVTPIAAVCPISFLSILRWANFRPSAEPLCKISVESTLKNPWGAFQCLLGWCKTVTHLFCFSLCLQTLLQQVERDLNVETLLEVIRDAFEFIEEADTLRSIMPESRQAAILEEMLESVSKCAEFIQSYAEDVHVGTSSSSLSLIAINMWFSGKRTLKSIVGQVDGKIEQYRADLVGLRKSFLARATVTTEVAVLEAGA
jgi:hypothetical protein